MSEYRLNEAGLIALAGALRGSVGYGGSCDGGLAGAVLSVERLVREMQGYAGHDKYTTQFHPAVDDLMEALREMRGITETGVNNVSTNMETMVITGVDTDMQNAEAQRKVEAFKARLTTLT